jgi:hypothetical protein
MASLVLTLLMAIAGGLAVVVGHNKFGQAGIVTASIAGTVCWLSALAALLVVAMTTATPSALAGVFGAMALRSGIPFVSAAVLATLVPSLKSSGLIGMFLVFFLVSLTVETVLSVVIVSGPSAGTKSFEASPPHHG